MLPRTRGRSYGSDSGLGKRGVDRDRGCSGGAVVEVAVVVESVSRASKERRRGIGRWMDGVRGCLWMRSSDGRSGP
jgi:hypothetical protein